jgi:ferredoxin-NADP reductase
MAIRKTAQVVSSEAIAPDVQLLTLEPPAPLDFVGGMYLIVDTGLVAPSGKALKRAYSILSPDDDQTRFQIAVKQVPGGMGSEWMLARRPGDEVAFSGPWGKYLPDDATPRPTWVIATDNGITAALGLVRGRAFAPQRTQARVLWLLEREDSFLPPPLVRKWMGIDVQIAPLPRVGHPERPVAALPALDRLFDGSPPARAYLSGDGDVLYPLRDRLGAHGVPAEAVRLECFFHNPQRLSP